jgi:hypothetical protein
MVRTRVRGNRGRTSIPPPTRGFDWRGGKPPVQPGIGGISGLAFSTSSRGGGDRNHTQPPSTSVASVGYAGIDTSSIGLTPFERFMRQRKPEKEVTIKKEGDEDEYIPKPYNGWSYTSLNPRHAGRSAGQETIMQSCHKVGHKASITSNRRFDSRIDRMHRPIPFVRRSIKTRAPASLWTSPSQQPPPYLLLSLLYSNLLRHGGHDSLCVQTRRLGAPLRPRHDRNLEAPNGPHQAHRKGTSCLPRGSRRSIVA